VTDTIFTGGLTFDVALTPDGLQAYVVDIAGELVDVVDLTTRTVTTSLPFPDPQGIAIRKGRSA